MNLAITKALYSTVFERAVPKALYNMVLGTQEVDAITTCTGDYPGFPAPMAMLVWKERE